MPSEAQNQPEHKGERIAKVLARAGVCSRRDAERLIAEGRVSVNGEVLESPALNVTAEDIIAVDGETVAGRAATRLWRYHKPKGLVTSHRDEQGRDTIFDHLPEDLPRVISVGRLDMNSEGLLLLTNNGALSRFLELPATGWTRKYRVRAFGRVTQQLLDGLKNGVTVEGVNYGPITATLEKPQEGQAPANVWISVVLREGKNREIRRVFAHLGLEVSRLIRVSYGPFHLGQIEPGGIEEVSEKVIAEAVGGKVDLS